MANDATELWYFEVEYWQNWQPTGNILTYQWTTPNKQTKKL